MITREDVLERAPQGHTAFLIADLIAARAKDAAAGGGDAVLELACDIVQLMTGHDDTMGTLDRYQVTTSEARGNQVVVWVCPVCPHVGIVMRDMVGDQSDLTLGEIVAQVIEHEDDAHR